jgi:hypothetical protein
MQKAIVTQHFLAAEAALKKGTSTSATAATRTAYAALAQAELAVCDFVLRYPDVTYGDVRVSP